MSRPAQYVSAPIDPKTWDEYRKLVKAKSTSIEFKLRHCAIFYSGHATKALPTGVEHVPTIHPLLVGTIPEGRAFGEPKYLSETWSTTPGSRQNPTETGR